jgi:isopentenyl-diphosphate delta-isomerase
MEQVILVNENDEEIGSMEKMQAHVEARLHRAFSVFVFNAKNELMLHKRAAHKYHSGGLWTNTCCSHPRPGEKTIDAAHRRLQEEMGFDCELTEKFSFLYCKELDHDLTENELDHVLTGFYENEPALNKDEVEDWRFISLQDLKKSLIEEPELYTEWFRIICEEHWQEILVNISL